MTNQKCKGARDLLPQDMEHFRLVEDAFRHSCRNWDYQEVRTPTLEYLHLFTAAGTLTPGMLSKVYSFLDWDGWSGERVVLRPDGTIPVARLYIENMAQEEITRLFYMTNVFAFEETGEENRERWQCGVELLGNVKPTADAELILLAADILRRLDISGVDIKLSHAGILKALLKELKLTHDEEARLLDQILDGNWDVLTQTGSGNPNADRALALLLELRGNSSGSLKNLKALPQIPPDMKSELDDFAKVTDLLDTLGCSYQIDITSTRGFEYYTGLCFQFLVGQNRIGSGGRYDNLVPLIGGKNTPACGFALYIDPLMDLVQSMSRRKTEQSIMVKGEPTPDTIKASFQLAQSLREVGYATELDFSNRRTSKQWVVTVQAEPSPFIVVDQMRNQKSEASSIADVIDIIGGSA